ncbi:MAG: MFS transporter [Verrucomicrobiae bacterium]|nr:MFS transporter [Verrucomicrobiae bacterium]
MSSPAPATHSGAWSVLNNRLFRALWLANVASGIGSAMHDTAAVWTMATLTTSATLVTLMQSMSSLPLFLLALPAGALADIVDRRRVILVAQIAALGVTALLVALAWTGKLTPGVLLGSTFLLGITVAFTTPTWSALLAEIVEKRDLPGALTLGSVAVNISRAVGPMIGGILLASTGPAAAFLLNGVSFLGIILVLWRWRRPPAPAGAHAERMLGAMVTALRFTRHSPVIQVVLVRNGLFAFFAIAPAALLPLIVRGKHLAAADFGLFMSAYGIGGILTAVFLLPKLRAWFSADQILGGATLLFGGAALALSFLHQRGLMTGVLFVLGAAWITCMATLAVAAQSAFPNWVRARSSAIHLIVMQGSLALGALVWGQVTMHSDPDFALRVAAGGLLLTLALTQALAVNPALQLDLTPSAHWAEHHLAVEPGDDDGPVVVSVHYEVPPEQTAAFSEAIARLRVIRLRDGAFFWALSEDLEHPGQFQETFHVGSWGEHLRQHQRATEEDRKVEEAVVAFHAGAAPLKITHHLMKDVRKVPLKSKA